MNGTASPGFTLIELLVVLTVIGLLLILLPPVITSGGAEIRAAARDVAAGLRRAQGQAIAQNREVAFIVDLEHHQFGIEGSDGPRRLPGGIGLQLYTARSELIDETTGAIRFFPDGTSTGGEITLSAEARDYHVAVDWLTGRISIRD